MKIKGTDINIPDSLVVDDLMLCNSSVTELPDGLTVKGGLNLNFSSIKVIPNGLTVGGELLLCHTGITQLPCDLSVGNLHLGYSDILDISPNLIVDDLYLNDTQITNLPKGITINGYLDLKNTQITSLPEGLTVGGSLKLTHTPIKKLPSKLTVVGDLMLNNSNVISIGRDLKVGDILDTRAAAIEFDKNTQLMLIRQNMNMIHLISNPTHAAIRLHNIMWEL